MERINSMLLIVKGEKLLALLIPPWQRREGGATLRCHRGWEDDTQQVEGMS